MSFPALRTNAKVPRTEMSSFTTDDKAAKTDDGKANPPARHTRNDVRAITRSSLPVVLEPHWELSIDSATD
ncbi:MAG TPA: hypothetical protein VGF45_09755 [Polyangia bacterium]